MNDDKGVALRGMEFARDLQSKFEVYFNGLIFTLLAASIQTAKFAHSPYADGLEILGWLALLISGLAGLSRFEWMPSDHETHARLRTAQNTMDVWRDVERRGARIVSPENEDYDMASILSRQKAEINEVLAHIGKREKKSHIKHDIRKVGFVLGVLLIIASRAYEPLENIILLIKQ